MLEIDGICKAYHGRQVLPPTRFVLPRGFCVGITGENGAGKSTLLRIIAQMEGPDGGDIRYQGKSILGNREFMRKNVGYVPQRPDLMEELTVNQQLKLWQSACGLRGKLPREPLDLMGVEPMLKSRISTLSGGMKQRVSIAMALLSSPEILIMDEATTGLDRDYRERLLSWLEGYLARGGRVLWCSHHARELERLCGSCLHIGARE